MRIAIPSPVQAVAAALANTPFAGDVRLVGGAVRDALLGRDDGGDYDLVTRGDAGALANLLCTAGAAAGPPVIYPQFGTAMVRVGDAAIELVTARRESYRGGSRKPDVEPGTYREDAERRDFTLNALAADLETGEVQDELGVGLDDLRNGVLRTPRAPRLTFEEDPLRMFRAVRFRGRFGFRYAPGLREAMADEAGRTAELSAERVRDELVKIVSGPRPDEGMRDLGDLGLLNPWWPELRPMRGCTQGNWHHLDVWEHTLLALKKANTDDPILALGVLLHDIGKPPTRQVDGDHIRFYRHEVVGAGMAEEMMRRLKFPERDVARVARLVKNHMRLGTLKEVTLPATRRLVRDLGEDTDRLLNLVDADASALAPGVRALDLAPFRARVAEVRAEQSLTPLRSPLTGEEIMRITGLSPGRRVGELKAMLEEEVVEGRLNPDDAERARDFLAAVVRLPAQTRSEHVGTTSR